ncbi:TetR/AcrR family transcriptional regulator [Agromyces sp. SYSU T00194]|uniref:TetR/AcrR family transcriptional regulator n=1 Tax=Agromyces chitinivorans TaxID=3158560 RepID=UPI003392B248
MTTSAPDAPRLDPRAERTRAALADALRRLLATTAIDEISVSALCREAGVHRTTFYGHFESVQDFAIEQYGYEFDSISVVDVDPSEGDPQQVAVRYEESLRGLLEHVVSERAGYRALLASRSRWLFHSVLDGRIRHRALLAVEVWAARDVPGAPQERCAQEEAAAYIAGGLIGAIETWAVGDEDDLEAAAERFTALLPSWWPHPTD